MRHIFRSPGFVGTRYRRLARGRYGYLKITDRTRHRALFSERHGIHYRHIISIGKWDIGVRP